MLPKIVVAVPPNRALDITKCLRWEKNKQGELEVLPKRAWNLHLAGQPERHRRLFNGTCARAVFAAVGRVCCSQRVGAGTFVGEGMNTLRPTGLAIKNEAPVGTVLGGLGGVSNAIAI